MFSARAIWISYLLVATEYCSLYAATNRETDAQVSLSKSRIMIGEQVLLQILVSAPNPHRIQWPSTAQLPAKVEVVHQNIKKLEADKESTRWQFSYTLTGFDAGNYSLASFPVIIQAGSKIDTILCNPPVLEIFTETITDQPFYEIHSIQTIPWPWVGKQNLLIRLSILLISIAAVSYIGFIFIRRYLKKMSTSKAYYRAIKKLDKVEKQLKKAPSTSNVSEPYQQVVNLLDVYFANTINCSLSRQSRNEFVATLNKYKIDTILILQLTAMLQEIDFERYRNATEKQLMDDSITKKVRQNLADFQKSVKS